MLYADLGEVLWLYLSAGGAVVHLRVLLIAIGDWRYARAKGVNGSRRLLSLWHISQETTRVFAQVIIAAVAVLAILSPPLKGDSPVINQHTIGAITLSGLLLVGSLIAEYCHARLIEIEIERRRRGGR